MFVESGVMEREGMGYEIFASSPNFYKQPYILNSELAAFSGHISAVALLPRRPLDVFTLLSAVPTSFSFYPFYFVRPFDV